jgi:colicin import membrane protein
MKMLTIAVTTVGLALATHAYAQTPAKEAPTTTQQYGASSTAKTADAKRERAAKAAAARKERAAKAAAAREARAAKAAAAKRDRAAAKEERAAKAVVPKQETVAPSSRAAGTESGNIRAGETASVRGSTATTAKAPAGTFSQFDKMKLPPSNAEKAPATR